MTERRKWGWIPDYRDPRDRLFAARPRVDAVPARGDLSALCPPIMNQGMLSSCTGNMLAGQLFALMRKDRGHGVPFSRLFIYYNERALENSIAEDSGAQIRDGLRSLVELGCCFEINWPYRTDQFATRPEFGCYVQAEQFQVTSYLRLDPEDPLALAHCLADRFTFGGGVAVFESFEGAQAKATGIIPMPSRNEKMLGGHAIHFVGWDMAERRYKFANSWGVEWGDKGFGYIPFEYVQNYGADFWTIRTGENL